MNINYDIQFSQIAQEMEKLSNELDDHSKICTSASRKCQIKKVIRVWLNESTSEIMAIAITLDHQSKDRYNKQLLAKVTPENSAIYCEMQENLYKIRGLKEALINGFPAFTLGAHQI